MSGIKFILMLFSNVRRKVVYRRITHETVNPLGFWAAR